MAAQVIKNCQSVSSRVAVLILRARQETPATLALVLDAVITRIVNEDGVIFKEAGSVPAKSQHLASSCAFGCMVAGPAGVSR